MLSFLSRVLPIGSAPRPVSPLRSVPLGGVDVFHWMNDRQMRARGLAGNYCAFVLELDGRIDPGALEQRLVRAVEALPELSWRMRAGLVAPRWVESERARPNVHVEATAAPSAPIEVIEARLNARIDGQAPWAMDLVRGVERDTLVFRWYHPFVDARGAERLVRWLGSGDASGPEPAPPEAERFERAERPLAKLSRRDRLEAMKAYKNHVIALGVRPILSPAFLRADRRPRRLPELARIVRVLLDEGETRAFDAIVRQRARLAESAVMAVACARALDSFFVKRGHAPPRYAIPMPLSLDPKADASRLFGNNLTMMMFALDRDDLADPLRAIGRLAEQQRAIVRGKLDVGMLAALEFARYLPLPAYQWVASRPFRGELASFVFSNPGAITVERFAGIAVRDAYPLPTVVTPPGVQMTFTRFGGRVSAFVGYLESAVDRAEAVEIADALRRELLS